MGSPSIRDAFLRRSNERLRCSKEFLLTIASLRLQGRKDVEAIWNAAFHVNLVSHDLMTFVYFTTTTPDVWARRSAARAIATVIFEGSDDLQNLLGKAFSSALRRSGLDDAVSNTLRTVKKKLSEFLKRNRECLKTIRMGASAHRESDCIKFMNAVGLASPDTLLALSSEFEAILRELGGVCQVAIDRIVTAERNSLRGSGPEFSS